MDIERSDDRTYGIAIERSDDRTYGIAIEQAEIIVIQVPRYRNCCFFLAATIFVLFATTLFVFLICGDTCLHNDPFIVNTVFGALAILAIFQWICSTFCMLSLFDSTRTYDIAIES